ncbi:MAG: radical SAM protein [Deltaproteobacteria bacterium]|nr:radical SAM protein [Deltaproteobacteria bacterium]
MLSKAAREETPEERLLPLKGKRSADAVLVHEVFTSIQGESTFAGRPCTFVRTTGCHLRCVYCDTAHAFHQGSERTVASLVDEVAALGVPLVEVTGGEPLLQASSKALLTALCDAGRTVLLETSGAVTTEGVDARVHVILDVKTPGSGEAGRNVDANLPRLVAGRDEVKLVLCDEGDYRFARQLLTSGRIPSGVTVLLSAAAPLLAPAELAEWMVRDRLVARFQLQVHKVLWGDRHGV